MTALVKIVIRAPALEDLRRWIAGRDLDLNCGGAKKSGAGDFVLEAYVEPQVAREMLDAGAHLEVDAELPTRAAARQGEVGAGDRFRGRAVVPKGTGRKV